MAARQALMRWWAVAVIAAVAANARASGSPVWAPVGVRGYPTEVEVLAADGRIPSFVYAQANGGPLLKSSDGGTTWAATGDLPPTYVRTVAIDSASPDTVYVQAGDGGIWRSDDAGGHFVQVREQAPNYDAEYLAAGPGVVLHTRNFDLYKSTDRGASWNLIYSGPVLDPRVNPGDATKLWVERAYPLGGILQSSDSGATWGPMGPVVSGTPAPGGFQVTPVPGEPSTLFGTAGGRLYRSFDAGASWVEIPGGGYEKIAVDPQSPFRLYGLTGFPFTGEAYFSDDGGFHWRPLKDPSPTGYGTDFSRNLEGLVWVNGTHRAVAGSLFAGVVHLDGDKASWIQGPWGLPNGPIHFVKSDPFFPATAVAGTTLGLSGSQDHGAIWITLPTNLLPELDDLEFDPDRQTLFAAAGSHAQGILRSTDSALTWKTIASAFGLRRATALLFRGGALLAGGAGIHRSVNGGSAWTEVLSESAGPRRRVVQHLIGDPDQAVAYALVESVETGQSAAAPGAAGIESAGPARPAADLAGLGGDPARWPGDSARTAADPLGLAARRQAAGGILELYRTSDGGQSWRAVAQGFSALAIDVRKAGRLYAGDPAGTVQVSEDGGDTWRMVGRVGAPINDLLLDFYAPGIPLLAATSGAGVLRSSDRGVTWQAINDGLIERERLAIGRLVIDLGVQEGQPHTIFAIALVTRDQDLDQPGLFGAQFTTGR